MILQALATGQTYKPDSLRTWLELVPDVLRNRLGIVISIFNTTSRELLASPHWRKLAAMPRR